MDRWCGYDTNWSRHIWYNRYETETNKVYDNLLKLVINKNYFVITTNVDHQFQLHGFDKKRLFYMQGDYGLFQCSVGCHQETYDNRIQVEKMMKEQQNMRIPTKLIPYCPKCGKPMVANLRCDDSFVQDDGWYEAKKRYDTFIGDNKDKNILFMELGVRMISLLLRIIIETVVKRKRKVITMKELLLLSFTLLCYN